MATPSYISVIERYHEYREAIRELMASILTGIADPRVLTEREAQRNTMRCLNDQYPFVDLLFTLDAGGIQTSENLSIGANRSSCDERLGNPLGKDRRQRPYYLLARECDGVVVTEPYLSSASRELCISAAIRQYGEDGAVQGYIVIDINLARTIEFLMGDTARRRFQSGFRVVYSIIVVGLMSVVGLLLYTAFAEMAPLFAGELHSPQAHLRPFGIIIFLTLGLAIFDLGKTVLEEEVLMHKDVYRHSSTRRTITRFIAAILIAVSIESLLLMFKSALGDGNHLAEAVWMMLAAVGLLVGLGAYVYLGARAEASLRASRG